jgi:hypothetical protein
VTEQTQEEISRAYNLKEFDALRSEIDDGISEARAFERYAVIASGALWAWLTTRSNAPLLLWCLPLLLVLAGWLRSWGLYKHLGHIGSYLKQIEDNHLTDWNGPQGWEKWLDKDRGFRRRLIDNWVWIILGVTAILAICYRKTLTSSPVDQPKPVVVEVRPLPCPTNQNQTLNAPPLKSNHQK